MAPKSQEMWQKMDGVDFLERHQADLERRRSEAEAKQKRSADEQEKYLSENAITRKAITRTPAERSQARERLLSPPKQRPGGTHKAPVRPAASVTVRRGAPGSTPPSIKKPRAQKKRTPGKVTPGKGTPGKGTPGKGTPGKGTPGRVGGKARPKAR